MVQLTEELSEIFFYNIFATLITKCEHISFMTPWKCVIKLARRNSIN